MSHTRTSSYCKLVCRGPGRSENGALIYPHTVILKVDTKKTSHSETKIDQPFPQSSPFLAAGPRCLHFLRCCVRRGSIFFLHGFLFFGYNFYLFNHFICQKRVLKHIDDFEQYSNIYFSVTV